MVLERWSSHCIAAAAGELKSELASVWGLVAMRCLVTHSSTWRFPARVVGGPGSGSWDHGAWSHGISLGNWSPRGRTAMPARSSGGPACGRVGGAAFVLFLLSVRLHKPTSASLCNLCTCPFHGK